MNVEELKALIDHLAQDGEAIATKLGRPAISATIEKLKLAAESPFFLEMLVMAIGFALSKFAATAPAEKPAS